MASIATKKADVGYIVKNGYLEFESYKDYQNLYNDISKKSEIEQTRWNKDLTFKSLELKYKNDSVQTYICENNVSLEPTYKLNIKRVNSILANIYNDKGIMVVNDTIYKIKDEYLYTITNGDFTLIDKIDENVDFKSKYILKQKHTVIIEPTKTIYQDSMQKIISDRTLVFYISSTRREFVTFDAYISGGFMNFDLKGHWQSKFLGAWLTPAADELVYGRINGTGTVGNVNVNTNYPNLLGEKKVNWNFYVGNPGEVPFNLDVTFNYKKTNSKAYTGSWLGTSNTTEGSFSKNYVWIQF